MDIVAQTLMAYPNEVEHQSCIKLYYVKRKNKPYQAEWRKVKRILPTGLISTTNGFFLDGEPVEDFDYKTIFQEYMRTKTKRERNEKIKQLGL